jgi:opacity protein-like surface antigen
MNILKTILLAGVFALPVTVAAQAADIAPDVPTEADTSQYGIYLRGDAGWSMLKWNGGDDDNAYVLGGGVGYQFNEMFRTDITADWSGNYKIAPGADISTTTLLGNVYLDWANDSAFTPYIGAGLGYGWVNGKGTAADDKGMALGLAAGVAVDLTQNLAVDVGYRFRDISIDGPDTKEHQATIGMRFKF